MLILPPRAIRLFVLLLALAASPAQALITGALGNDPVHDAGWPLGAVDVANLKSRVGYWEGPPFGGGQYEFLYRGDTAAFNAALEQFSKIRTPVRELVIHDGPQESFYLNIERKQSEKLDARVDWTFTVWIPASFHQLYNAPNSGLISAGQPEFRGSVDPPRMQAYVGGGGIEWDKVKVPANVKVIDKRASAAGVKVEGGALIRVNVYDMATGKPVAKAKLTIAQPAENTNWQEMKQVAQAQGDEIGFIEASKLPAGHCMVTVEAQGYAPRVIGYEVLKINTFLEHDIELSKAVTLEGQVLDANGNALENVRVRPTPLGIDGRGYNTPEREVKTDEKGRFKLTDMPEGYTRLSCYRDGWHQIDPFKMIGVGKMMRSDDDDRTVTVRMTSTGNVLCKVTTANGQPPQGRVHVFIEPEVGGVGSWGGAAQLGTDGTFEFKNVPPGKYFVSTKMDSNRKLVDAVEVNVTPGKTIKVDIASK